MNFYETLKAKAYVHPGNVHQIYGMLKDRVIRRKAEFDRFIYVLEQETTWFSSPASTRFHLSEHQGLLMHSVGVTKTLLEMKQHMMPQLDDESAIICGLFHDVGKLGMPGTRLYLEGPEGYRYNPKVVSMGLGVRSLFLTSRYVTLSDDEAQAIAYHDGQYIDENHIVAHRERPLTVLLHSADYWTSHIFEHELMRNEFLTGKETMDVPNRGYQSRKSMRDVVEPINLLDSY
ncbi:MAG: phosphohydrolase [Candidatus Atribacteria bacterium]|nr:MAG: phosphohydrolase [Candidatus Atribacteria bacterium]